jgi:hypothetical protein
MINVNANAAYASVSGTRTLTENDSVESKGRQLLEKNGAAYRNRTDT